MKNTLLTCLAILFVKLSAAIASDVTKSKAQNPYILQGGNFAQIGEIPATVDSFIHIGTPSMSGLRVYCTETDLTYIGRSGVWQPIVYLKPTDTGAMLQTVYAADVAMSGMRSKVVTDSNVLASGINGKVSNSDTTNRWYPKSANPSGYLTSGSITGKVNYTDTTTMLANYQRKGLKIGVPYSATTNASGVATVTFSTTYSVAPNIVINFTTSNPRDVIMLTSSSTTGCSLLVQRRVDVLGLLPSYTNQSGINCDIIVTEK